MHDTEATTITSRRVRSAAVVEWRTTIPSTGGPVEHVKFACPVGHRYFMPAEGLE